MIYFRSFIVSLIAFFVSLRNGFLNAEVATINVNKAPKTVNPDRINIEWNKLKLKKSFNNRTIKILMKNNNETMKKMQKNKDINPEAYLAKSFFNSFEAILRWIFINAFSGPNILEKILKKSN